jgi:pimeloyl-ACP methyl ester carboxylesterase
MTDPVLQALREIVPVTRGQVNLGGRMLRWVESGTGTPTVVLIAGRNDTALSWGPVLAALAGRVRAVAYDRAELGDSDPDLKTPSTERTVADLSRLVNVVSAGPWWPRPSSAAPVTTGPASRGHPGARSVI